MKTFIVSMGLVIMGIFGLCFQWDMNNYTLLQTNLKALTESCCAFAAVNYNENSYSSDDDIEYFEDDVRASLEYFFVRASSNMPCFQSGTLAITALDCDSVGDKVSVSITFTSERDFFRNPFINKNEITHSSCYEWVSY